MGFAPLQHIRMGRSTFSRVCLARFVPPSGFGYPLGGFLPARPCRSCFIPTALLGFPLRSVPLSKGIHAFPRRWTHLPLRTALFQPTNRRAGPRPLGFWALTLPRVPRSPYVFSPRTAGCSHGVSFFQGSSSKALPRIPPRLLSRASRANHPKDGARRHPRVSSTLA
jgi:hypothetical protein